MKKLLVPVVILLVCAFIITGCGTDNNTPTAPGATTPSATQPAATTPSSTNPAATTASATKPAATPAPSTTAPAGNIVKGGTLKWIEPSGPATPIGWNPETSGGSVFTMQFAMQFLLKEQLDGSLTPNLAASYDVVSDPANASITFHLQKGVKFHDGTDFNAQAVKWNFEQVKAGGMNNGTTQFWKSFDIIDDYTIRVNLTTWQNRMIRSFGDGVAYQCSPTAFEKNGIDWMRWNMVGTGPFMQKEFLRDVSLTATRNPNYWEAGKPYLDGVQLLYVTDELTRLALFKSGGADVLNCNGNGRIANELQSAGYKIYTQAGSCASLIPDSANPDSPWSNAKVRMAAEYAIDKETMAKTFGYGFTTPAYQLNQPSNPAHDSKLPQRKYDVAKAKQLLTEAGYPNGFKTTIWMGPQGQNKDIAATLQSYLGKVGITVDLQFPEAAAAQAQLSGTWKNGLLYNPLMLWANPNTGFNFYFGVPKSSWFQSLKRPDGWADVVVPSLVAPKVDAALAQKAEAALVNDCTFINLFYSTAQYATTTRVQDSSIGTRGANTWWEPQQTWFSK